MILVISSKHVYAAKRLLQESKSRNLELGIMDVGDLVAREFEVNPKDYQALYVRDPYLKGSPEYIPKIIRLAKNFKAAGKKVVDAVIANGELGRGKWADYERLIKAVLPIPETNLLSGYKLNAKRYPLILKWTYGFKGKHTFLVKDEAEFHPLTQKYPAKELLVQEFIPAEFEYKIITVGYKALPVVLRFKIKNSGFRADFKKYEIIQTPTTSPPLAGLLLDPTSHKASSDLRKEERLRGISKDNRGASPPLLRRGGSEADGVVGADKIKELTHLAEQSSRVLKRELAKVDILESRGKFYILEVNRFPGLKSFEEFTKYNATKEFLEYLSR